MRALGAAAAALGLALLLAQGARVLGRRGAADSLAAPAALSAVTLAGAAALAGGAFFLLSAERRD